MNIHDPNIATPKVTTGALPSSRKIYARPDAAPELRVDTSTLGAAATEFS